jgi:RNA polymerase sigma-70 factor, ECF subfamily
MSRDETFNGIERLDAACAPAELMMDEDAFRAFYDRTATGVWAYLVRLTGSRNAADDLLQETFYRFLRSGAAHESEAHKRNSLYRIATNLARDARRRSLLRPASGQGDSDIERIASPVASASPDRAADVNRAMTQLKPNERAMLWMAYAEGATHPEIASVLGVNPASMKVLLFRARRKLAALLRGEK